MEKRVAVSIGSSGGEPERCRWSDGLNPELLALIFVRIPADMMSRTVPLVCRSWWEAVAGPYCWAEVDIEQWCRRVNNPEIIDPTVQKLVRRSKGTVRRLSAYRLSDSCFSFVAGCGRFLSILQIPMSEVTDHMVEKHAPSLATLTVLDISYCIMITSKGIEALGQHCKSLIQLKRNMPPPEFDFTQGGGVTVKVEEEEAMAVANTMPGLEHLELAYGRFSDQGLDAIVTKCRALCLLDIRGCWNTKMVVDIERKCDLIQAFRDPWEDEFDDANSSGDDGGDYGNDCGDDEDNNEDDACLVDVDTSDESDDD